MERDPMDWIDFSKLQQLKASSLNPEISDIVNKIKHNINDTFFTSGTTGQAKKIIFTQKQIQASVNNTLSFFNLKEGNQLVNPLSLAFVAGKMNVYRAIYGKMKYLQLNPKSDFDTLSGQAIDFISVVPNQLQKLKKAAPRKVKNILLGGGQVYDLDFVQDIAVQEVYQSFSMTETLTHFGIRQLHPKFEASYHLMEGFSLNPQKNKLNIYHPIICPDGVRSDDCMQIHKDRTFEWLGRYNNMLKCGGLKLFPELLEAKINNIVSNNFTIVGKKDNTFGEVPVLCIEADVSLKKLEAIKTLVNKKLSKYEQIKKVYAFEQFPRTHSGKIKKQELRETINLIK